MDRAMSEENLDYIIHSAQSTNPSVKRKAFIALHQLSQFDRNKLALVKRKTMKILAKSLRSQHSEVTNRHAVACLYHLIANNDKRKTKLLGYNVIDSLSRLLKENPNRYSDLKYWCIMLLHQFCLTDSITMDQNILYILNDMSKLTFNNATIQKLCFHSMVRILSGFDDEFATKCLEKLAKNNLISLISACLRNSDAELCHWTLFLLHEFAIRKVKIDEIVRIKGLLKIMLPFVQKTDTIVPRIILRTLKSIFEHEKSFYRNLNKGALLKIILSCLSCEDEQTQYWTLALLHILTYQMGNHKEFFQSGGLEELLKICSSSFIHVRMYVVEIISILCADPSNVEYFEKSPLLFETIIGFLDSTELELKHSSLSLIVNLLAISKQMANNFSQTQGLLKMSQIFLDGESSESLRPIACKAISCMSFQDPQLTTVVLNDIIVPGFFLLFQHITDAVEFSEKTEDAALSPFVLFSPPRSSSPKFLFGSLEKLAPTLPGFPTEISSENIGQTKQLLRVASTFECLHILMTSDLIKRLIKGDFDGNSTIHELYGDIGVACMNSLLFPRHANNYADEEVSGIFSMKKDIAIQGLQLLHAVIPIPRILASLIENSVLKFISSILTGHGEELTRQCSIALCIYVDHCISSKSGEEIKGVNVVAELDAIKKQIIEIKTENHLYLDEFIKRIDSLSNKENAMNDSVLKAIDVDVFKYSLHVRNRVWTFGTAFSTRGARYPGKYAYEFELGSDGVIQIGWATENFEYNEFGGWGVGDYKDSYAYDGNRIRKWNGRDVDEDSYGSKWAEKDIVTCLLDLDENTISFLLNGVDLGIAFREIDNTKLWLPAVSLTGGQWGCFRFGGSLSRIDGEMKFCPSGFSKII